MTSPTSQQQQQQTISADTAAVMAHIPYIPEVLEFESSWHERNNEKRYMLILFFPLVNQFQIMMDDSKIPLTITVENPRTQEPMRAWDLHVGAVIDVLGRQTTLMSASMKTMKWLDEQARRLWKQKTGLETKLNKFRSQPHTDLSFGLFKRLDTSKGSLGGIINIGRIARCVSKLEEELSKFQ